MKSFINLCLILVLLAGVAISLSGCSGGSTPGNVVAVRVSPAAASVIAGQPQTFTATVTGTDTTTVTNWTCTYAYLPAATSTNPSPKKVTGTCTSGGTISGITGKIGTWVISTANSSNVLTYTAPDLADFPNPVPVLTFQPIPDADKNLKCNAGSPCQAEVGLDSGIRVSITPTSATVPVGLTPAQTVVFVPSFLNANASGQQFKLIQPNSASTTEADRTATPQTPDTCDPTCGTIDNATGIYTAPATLPTDTKPAGSKTVAPTTVYLVAWNAADPNHYATSIITLVSATNNPVTFSSIYPQTVPAGGLLQDVFLNAKNLLNTTQINFVPPTVQSELTGSSGTPLGSTQIFTIPISLAYCTASASGVTPVVTCDASLVTRVRLNATQLANPEPSPNQPAWLMIPNLPGSQTAQAPCVQVPSISGKTAIACPLHLVNASPALVAATPDSFPQSATSGNISIGVDGGYYGATGGQVQMTFNDQAILVQSQYSSSVHLLGTQSNFQLPNPGLYEVTVNSSTSTGAPPLFKSVTTNAAIQPDFFNFNPNPANTPSSSCTTPGVTPAQALPGTYPNCVLLNGGGNPAPSSIALNSVKGYAVITEQGTNALQLIDLTSGVPTQSGSPVSIAPATQPTDIAIDPGLTVNGGDLGIVVSSGDSKLYLYSINPQLASPFTFIKSVPVDLQTLLSQTGNTSLPPAFAFGVDPSTHLGVVVYSGTSIGTNIAFIVDVNPNLDGLDKRTCFVQGQTPPCVISPVTVVTGPTPRVVMQPNVPLAYVTPGGANASTSVVDLLQKATSVQILPASTSTTATGAFRAAGITTIKTVTPHGINAALGGTVIISGITSQNGTNFNGTFPVSVVDPYTFSYAQTGLGDDQETNTGSAGSTTLGTVQYGSPYYAFSTTANVSGAAINPYTRTFAYADFALYSQQIGFISTLDQSLTSLSLSAGSCNGCTPTPAGGPENGFRSVAWDPFTNVLMAYNPGKNAPSLNSPDDAISLINPGGPAPSGSANPPYRIIAAIPTGQLGQGSYTAPGASTATNVYGPMTYDPRTKYVLVANAGSNSLSYMSLDPNNTFQKVHIQDLQLPANACTSAATCFAVPTAQPALGTLAPATTCSPTDPVSTCMPQGVRVGRAATIRLLGQGFSSIGSKPIVRLDGQASIIPPGATTPVTLTSTLISDNEIDVSIPAAILFAPHDYAVDVLDSTGAASNSFPLHVVGILDLSGVCTPTSVLPQGPEGVAIDQTRHIAVITNYACSTASVINLDSTGTLYPGASFGAVLGSVPVGKQPVGVGIISRLGYAVVANNGDAPTGTASIIDISTPTNPKIVTWTSSTSSTTTDNAVAVGLAPLGVAIDQDRALALVANSGSNTLSSIDLTVLAPSVSGGHTQSAPVATTIGLSGPPTAIAVNPNLAAAAVTSLQHAGTTSVTGGIDVVNLASVPPTRSTSASISSLTVNPTGIVYNPGDPNQTPVVAGTFYVTSTQQNAVYSYNPSTTTTGIIRVGVNPYSLGFNYQTGTLLTINSTSGTSSVIDSQNFKTRDTLGITSLSQFAIDVDQFANAAVIVDQNNNRVVFLAMPH